MKEADVILTSPPQTDATKKTVLRSYYGNFLRLETSSFAASVHSSTRLYLNSTKSSPNRTAISVPLAWFQIP
jgi:hypothetical protein